MSTELKWANIATVAPQKGYEKNIGTAGLVKGVIGNKLIFGGGANFPSGLPVDGGVKVNHKDVYLYEETAEGVKLLDQIQFDYPLAYGASAVYNDTLYYIATKNETSSDLLAFTVVEDKLKVEVVDTLPFTVENIIARIHENKLYFGIGSINGSNNNELYSYDLATKKFEVFSEFPGKLRNQAVSYVYNNELYVFGGGASETYSDGYKVNLTTKEWTKLADVVIDNEEISLLGADWAPLNDHELLVVGGFNKDVWKDAVFNLTTLKGEDHAKYRDAYFRRPVSEYKWNKKEFVYNLKENRWYQLGEIPFESPCGHALLATKTCIYSVMGEIKPAERKPFIHRTSK